MPPNKTLNAANLEALGASRLAALLLEITTGDAAARRQLRLALAGSAGPEEAAREVSKRLASIAKGRTFLEWNKVKPLAAELEAQRRAILDSVAPSDPVQAFDLLWRFIACAGPVYDRSDDSSGYLGAVFHQAVLDLGPLAMAAKPDPEALAERIFQAVRTDRYDASDELVPVLAPQLGAKGLGQLKDLAKAWQSEKVAAPPERERRVVGWSSSGKIYADEIEASHRRSAAKLLLEQIADALGDVNGYIAQIEPTARKMPAVAAGIARRLLEAGRPKEAFDVLEAVPPERRVQNPAEWEQARIDALEALGRAGDAQAFRWSCFLASLNADLLRAYLRKLPDFEDFDAEQKALTHAVGFANVHVALAFLIDWPDLRRASELVLTRINELNGNIYELLSPAADALGEKQPLAATLLRRSLIDFTLSHARTTRYRHAARHFRECAALATFIADFGATPDHRAYEKALREAHGRKAAFWQEVQRLM